jgi:hypothetical protein
VFRKVPQIDAILGTASPLLLMQNVSTEIPVLIPLNHLESLGCRNGELASGLSNRRPTLSTVTCGSAAQGNDVSGEFGRPRDYFAT